MSVSHRRREAWTYVGVVSATSTDPVNSTAPAVLSSTLHATFPRTSSRPFKMVVSRVHKFPRWLLIQGRVTHCVNIHGRVVPTSPFPPKSLPAACLPPKSNPDASGSPLHTSQHSTPVQNDGSTSGINGGDESAASR